MSRSIAFTVIVALPVATPVMFALDPLSTAVATAAPTTLIPFTDEKALPISGAAGARNLCAVDSKMRHEPATKKQYRYYTSISFECGMIHQANHESARDWEEKVRCDCKILGAKSCG